MHRYRLLIGTIALASVSQAVAQPVQTCRIDGFAAASQARANGFQFVTVDSTATTCDVENASVVVSAPQDREARCRLRLFAGQPLTPGWTLFRIVIEFSPPNARAVLSPLPAGKLLSVTVPKGKTGLFTIRKVHLRGADCDKWREAFG